MVSLVGAGNSDETSVTLKKQKTSAGPQKGRTLHLYDPDDIAALTPCTIIHNFLPAALANDLLAELLAESASFGRSSFKLFDRVVSSPHTSCFYVQDHDELRRQQTLLLEQRELSEREHDRSEEANIALQHANLDLEQRLA